MRCHYAYEDGFRFIIPGCWSNALSSRDDMRDCTCYKPVFVKPKKSEEQKIEDLEGECRQLREINEKLTKANARLRREVEEVRYKGLPLVYRRKIETLSTDGKSSLWAIIENYFRPLRK